MSYTTKFFEWDVSPNQDQLGTPVGYEFEFKNISNEGPITYSLSTFGDSAVIGDFAYSFDGSTFFDFPVGDSGKKFYTDYVMRVTITDAMNGSFFALSNGIVYRITSDGRKKMETFDTTLSVSSISVDSIKNDLYLLVTNTLFCLRTNGKMSFKNSFNLSTASLDVVVDGSRNIFWDIKNEKVHKRSLSEGTIISTHLLGSEITNGTKTYLNNKNGNLVLSAQTDGGFEIFEIDLYSGAVSSDSSANLILDIGVGESGYFVTFNNQYIGEFNSGVLDETYIDTLRDKIINITGDLDEYFFSDNDSGEIVSFSLPYSENWDFSAKTSELGDLTVRGNDMSVIYSNEDKKYLNFNALSNLSIDELFKKILIGEI